MKKAAASYSPHSAAAESRLRELQRALEKVSDEKKEAAGRLGTLRAEGIESAERMLQRHYDKRPLDDTLAEIDRLERRIRYFEGQEATLAKQIEEFRAELEAQKPERAKNQQACARLADERLGTVRKIAALFEEASRLIGEHAQQTARIKQSAQSVGLSVNLADGVERLALDTSFVLAAENSAARLKGEADGRPGFSAYVVVSKEGVTLPESIAHCGLHKFGETVWLTSEESADLASWERTGQKDAFGKRERRLPDVVTPELFERTKGDYYTLRGISNEKAEAARRAELARIRIIQEPRGSRAAQGAR